MVKVVAALKLLDRSSSEPRSTPHLVNVLSTHFSVSLSLRLMPEVMSKGQAPCVVCPRRLILRSMLSKRLASLTPSRVTLKP